MKSNELKAFIEETIFSEVKNTILNESKNEKKDVYHIMCDGKPLASFESKKDAELALPKFKKENKGKKLIIEKVQYESYADMIEALDKMSEELEETTDMKNENMNESLSPEGAMKLKNACDKLGCRRVAQKLIDKFLINIAGVGSSDLPDSSIYADGLDEIEVLLDDEDWDVAISVAKETAESMLEDEGFSSIMDMDEESENMEGNEFTAALAKAKEEGNDKFTVDGKEYDVKESWGKMEEDEDENLDKEIEEEMLQEYFEDDEVEVDDLDDEDYLSASELAKAIGDKSWMKDEDKKQYPKGVYDEFKKEGMVPKDPKVKKRSGYGYDSHKNLEDFFGDVYEGDVEEAVKGMCSECGKMLTEEGTMCSECMSLKEHKSSTKIKLKESQLRRVVKNLISEAMKGQPGIPGVVGKTVAMKAGKESGKEAKSHLKDVEKKMKDYLSFDGNTNPEFPNQIGGERMAIHPSKEQAEEIAKNKAGLQNLDYDLEPSENFKKRLEAALLGDTKMGNSAVTGKNSVETSNGAKAVDAKEKSGNTIPTETDKMLKKQIEDRQEDKDERTLYNRAAVPTKNISESVDCEVDKMKRLLGYNKRTQ